MKPIQAHRARLLPVMAAVGALYGLAGMPAQASSHREAPAITQMPKLKRLSLRWTKVDEATINALKSAKVKVVR